MYSLVKSKMCTHTISIEAKWQSKVDGALCATMIEMKSYYQTVSMEPAVSKHFTQNVKQQCAIWKMVGYLRRKFKCQNVCARRQILSTHQKRNRSITLWDVITNKVPLRGKSPFAMLTCLKLNRHQVTSNNHNSTTARLTLIRCKCDCVCVSIWVVGSFTDSLSCFRRNAFMRDRFLIQLRDSMAYDFIYGFYSTKIITKSMTQSQQKSQTKTCTFDLFL